MPEPRFSIGEASRAVIDATEAFGPEYQSELASLLDPHNGRMDIVPGKGRINSWFTWGAYGATWVVYLQGFDGYLADVVVLAHECAHAVHFSLFSKAGVPWYYGYGAPYVTEGFAKLGELLVLDRLAASAQSRADRLLYLRQLNSKLASVRYGTMFGSACATGFETEVYRRVQEGIVKKPEDIHELWAELGRAYTPDFDRYSDVRYTWAAIHQFFDASRYYSNYLFAWILAVSMYERLQADPAFAGKIVDLMKAGWSDEPAVLLRTRLGIDLQDPKTLSRVFSLIEKRLAEFEKEIQADQK